MRSCSSEFKVWVSSVVDAEAVVKRGFVDFSLLVMLIGSFFLRLELKFWSSFSASFCAASLGDRLLLATEGVSGVVITVERDEVPLSADLGVEVDVSQVPIPCTGGERVL